MDWGLAKVLPRGGASDDAEAGKVEETIIATAPQRLGLGPVAGRQRDGHAGLHGAGAGARRDRSGGRARRCLRPGLDPLRNPHRPARLHRPQPGRDPAQGRARRPGRRLRPSERMRRRRRAAGPGPRLPGRRARGPAARRGGRGLVAVLVPGGRAGAAARRRAGPRRRVGLRRGSAAHRRSRRAGPRRRVGPRRGGAGPRRRGAVPPAPHDGAGGLVAGDDHPGRPDIHLHLA